MIMKSWSTTLGKPHQFYLSKLHFLTNVISALPYWCQLLQLVARSKFSKWDKFCVNKVPFCKSDDIYSVQKFSCMYQKIIYNICKKKTFPLPEIAIVIHCLLVFLLLKFNDPNMYISELLQPAYDII